MRHNWTPKGERKQKCENCKMKLETKDGARGGQRQYYDGVAYSPRVGVPLCKPRSKTARRPSKTARR